MEMIHYGSDEDGTTRHLARFGRDYRGNNVTVNAVLQDRRNQKASAIFFRKMAEKPGADRSKVADEFFKSVRPTSLLRRFARPEEVAAMVAFVCSPLASATNGAGAARGRRRGQNPLRDRRRALLGERGSWIARGSDARIMHGVPQHHRSQRSHHTGRDLLRLDAREEVPRSDCRP